jgi:hypothetical protein
MGWAVAVPIIASAVGGYLQSRGAGKAAANSKPQIPDIFKRPVGAASKLLWQDILHGLKPYQGQLTAGPTDIQNKVTQMLSSLFGSSGGGGQSPWDTLMGASQTGLSQDDIDLALKQTNPLFEFQKSRSLADLREAQSQGGRYFSSGAIGQEGDMLAQMEAGHSSQILPLAIQMLQNRVGAAQSMPGFLGSIFGVGEGQRQIEQQGLTAQMSEWLRQQPENAISMLAGLMGGTPFYNPAIAPNAAMTIGAGASGLGSSEGFMKLLQDYLNKSKTGG